MTSDSNRGKVFGQMQSAFMVGMFCTTMVAGNVANLFVFHIAGWRIAVGLASIVAYLVTGISGEVAFFFSNLVFSGVIKLPIFGGIKHCTSMVILRDVSFNSAFLGLVILWIYMDIMTPGFGEKSHVSLL